MGPVGMADVRMLADSGSTETMVPESALTRIGVVAGPEEVEIAGIGGHVVRFKIANLKLSFGFGRFQLQSRVAAYPSAVPQLPALGCRDFFLAYRVCFMAGDGVFTVNVR
jgi:hypothetical protein